MKIKVIGVLLLLVGFLIIVSSIYNNQKMIEEDNDKIDEYFELDFNNSEDIITEDIVANIDVDYSKYIAVLEIPAINLKTGIVLLNKSNSSLNRNVSLYSLDNMPNKENSNFILFGHNGNSSVSYFNKIDKLKVDQEIYVYYKGVKYIYLVKHIKEVAGNNTDILKQNDESIITLITCKKGNNKMRVVVIGELLDLH